MPKTYTSDPFVSYATEDLDLGVANIFMSLYEIGVISTWIDRLVIKPGDSIPTQVDYGLRTTRYLLPIVTSQYFKKSWTRAELDAVKMLLKPAIPIWIDVTPSEVKSFSPTLAAHKAIIYDADPYDVAEQVGQVLFNNKRTHFYKGKASRDEAVLFWRLVYVYALHIVQGDDPDQSSFFIDLNRNTAGERPSLQDHVRSSIDINDEGMRKRAGTFQETAAKLGNIIRYEDIAHLIVGEIKRRQAWFPHEPREHEALRLIGLERF